MSPCLQDVDPGDNSTAYRRIRFGICSPARRWPLGGRRDTARAPERHARPSASRQMPAGLSGRRRHGIGAEPASAP
jgi:hypothetical protein